MLTVKGYMIDKILPKGHFTKKVWEPCSRSLKYQKEGAYRYHVTKISNFPQNFCKLYANPFFYLDPHAWYKISQTGSLYKIRWFVLLVWNFHGVEVFSFSILISPSSKYDQPVVKRDKNVMSVLNNIKFKICSLLRQSFQRVTNILIIFTQKGIVTLQIFWCDRDNRVHFIIKQTGKMKK